MPISAFSFDYSAFLPCCFLFLFFDLCYPHCSIIQNACKVEKHRDAVAKYWYLLIFLLGLFVTLPFVFPAALNCLLERQRAFGSINNVGVCINMSVCKLHMHIIYAEIFTKFIRSMFSALTLSSIACSLSR